MDEADPARSKAYTRAAEQHKERVEAAASRQSATFHSCTTVFYRSETRARRMRDAEKNSGRWTVQYRLQRVQVMRVCVPSRRRGAWRELSERTDIECAKILGLVVATSLWALFPRDGWWGATVGVTRCLVRGTPCQCCHHLRLVGDITGPRPRVAQRRLSFLALQRVKTSAPREQPLSGAHEQGGKGGGRGKRVGAAWASEK